MEHKIDEIFEVEGITLQAIETEICIAKIAILILTKIVMIFSVFLLKELIKRI